MREFAWIEYLKQRLSQANVEPDLSVRLGIGDDCALLAQDNQYELAISTDSCVEGTHFYPGTDPYSIGVKACASALSDLAAMGAKPWWCTLALNLPKGTSENWLQRLADGVLETLQTHKISLIGGDTTRGPLNLTLTVAGQIPQGLALRRIGAQVDDLVYVSGRLGEAACGLWLRQQELGLLPFEHASVLNNSLRADFRSQLLSRLDQPTPRLALGQALRCLATAAIDISDGAFQDAGHLAARSGVAIDIDINKVRAALSPNLLAAIPEREALLLALSGGEDYELCFTAPDCHRETINALALELDLPLFPIGRCRAGSGIHLLNDSMGLTAQLHNSPGFEH